MINTTSNIGRGTWKDFNLQLEDVFSASLSWKDKLSGIDKCWLCWNVDSEWCYVQQQLIEYAGWTPIVGFDPRSGPPSRRTPNAVVIDFNETFHFEKLFPHFVLEFAFLFSVKLAFWHSDLLLTKADMRYYADMFEKLENGAFSAVKTFGGTRGFFQRSRHRYWELLGCTTALASQSQFNSGCGWWRHFYLHPNYTGRQQGPKAWEYGCGIMAWKRNRKITKGHVYDLKEKHIKNGHFTRIGNKNYIQDTASSGRNLNKELSVNYNLDECCRKLGIADLLKKCELCG